MVKVRLWLFFYSTIQLSWGLPKVTNFSCNMNDKYCNNNDCSLSKLRKVALAEMRCNLTQPIYDAQLRLQLLKKDRNGSYKKFFVDSTEDVCKILGYNERSLVASRMIPMWRQFNTNVQLTCPIQGILEVKHYPLDLSLFPSVVPEGSYQLIGRLFRKNLENILEASIFFEITYKQYMG